LSIRQVENEGESKKKRERATVRKKRKEKEYKRQLSEPLIFIKIGRYSKIRFVFSKEEVIYFRNHVLNSVNSDSV
jgi:hypothetical protein